jgi:hypothetical protein
MGKGLKTFCFLKILVLIRTSSLILFYKNKIKSKNIIYLFIYLLSWLFAKKSPQINSNIWLFHRKAKDNKQTRLFFILFFSNL